MSSPAGGGASERAQTGAELGAGVGHGISWREAIRVWIRVALLSFGGPAGQIAVMHRIFVEEKKWISESRFLHALNYCMLLPGPEATQLVTYIGWLMHRTLGGVVAGVLFVLPGMVALLGLSYLYAGCHDWTVVSALFFGLKPAVLALVVEALFRIGKRALKNRLMLAIAAGAFLLIFFLRIPFPAIILAAGLTGWLGGRLRPDLFEAGTKAAPSSTGSTGSTGATGATGAVAETAVVDGWLERAQPAHVRPNLGRALRVLLVCLVLWFAPLAILLLFVPVTNLFVQEDLFFSQAAVVTFGGAYSVLAYLAQQAVERYHWLSAGQMLDGLGMAETTPGPLIMVVQFVGFMGAYNFATAQVVAGHPGVLSPMVAGTLAALLTTWVTFVPCFLWIFLGAPYIESLRNNKALTHALSGITASVVGVILNLAVWFALHTVFGFVGERWVGPLRYFAPDWRTLEPGVALLAVAALYATSRWKVGMVATLGGAALLGMLYFYGRQAYLTGGVF